MEGIITSGEKGVHSFDIRHSAHFWDALCNNVLLPYVRGNYALAYEHSQEMIEKGEAEWEKDIYQAFRDFLLRWDANQPLLNIEVTPPEGEGAEWGLEELYYKTVLWALMRSSERMSPQSIRHGWVLCNHASKLRQQEIRKEIETESRGSSVFG